ncbi:MAG: Na+/H+ antiporter subunit E [Bacteroidales bacterium]|nr:Na+/H+ antiporter subunit E [Bacteroidales bacterium]
MSRYLLTSFVLFIIWLAMTSTLAIQEVVTGLIVSMIIAVFSYKHFTEKGLSRFKPIKVVYMIQYLFVFLWELIKANLDVAVRVINPHLPINPGIVSIKTELKSSTAKMILANSITLTPGTLSVDLIDDTLYVHWLVITESDPALRTKAISGQFEPLLKKIFS